jgi:hypothetical protein
VEVIAANPWALLVGCTDEAPLASHIPDSRLIRRARRDAARTSRASQSTFEAAEPERPIFETEARDHWVRIGHGAGVINFDSTLFADHEIPPDKARR